MKMVLVKPPERSFMNFGAFSLGVLGAAVRHLADVTIVDATELPLEEAVALVRARDPDWIGITAMGIESLHPSAEFVRCWKRTADGRGRAAGQTRIVGGGHGATMVPDFLLAAGADAVVLGEGERTFSHMVENGIVAGAPGVACKVEGQVVAGSSQNLIGSLDQLPVPARDLMPVPPNGIHLIESSRGCPHACAFCETTRFFGKRWRPKSPERVVHEVRELMSDYGAWIIHFADDSFAASPSRVRHICELLQTNEALPAFFMASARSDDLMTDPDLLPSMAAARMLRITVGVETLDRELSSVAGKPIRPEIYKELFARMAELGMFSVASFIVGLPGETAHAREMTLELALDAGPDSAHFLPFMPLPGIPLTRSRAGLEPDPSDAQFAQKLNAAFFRHPTVRARLRRAVNGGGIRGLLAEAALKRNL